MILATGILLLFVGLVGIIYGVYALSRGGRDQEGGGLGPIPERAIHAIAGTKMLVGGVLAILLGIVAILAAFSA